jgi:signal transduction histidine kinase
MFNRARLKLTAWYLLIIMIVSVSFSAVIFQVLTFELTRFNRMQRLRLERQLEAGHFEVGDWPHNRQKLLVTQTLDPELIYETQRRLLFTLLAVNGVILIIAGGLGYLLAGKTLQPIKNMVDEQNQFVSDASHELKTPLTALKTSLEVHQRDKRLNLKTAKNLINDSLIEVDKLQSLTEGLLQLAEYEQSPAQLVVEPVSMLELAKQAVQRIKPLAKKKKIKIEQQIGDVTIKGDFDKLTELLVILLDNAIKYSPQNSKITLSAQKTDGRVLITVKDQGVGINPENLPKIFDRFFRVDVARTKNGGNSGESNGNGSYGLGLSIAKKIVQAHGGKIEVESQEGKGSIFKIALPVFS